MKIAVVLMAGGLFLNPGLALAQSANGELPDRAGKSEAVKIPRGNPSSPARGADSDRAIDAELHRIDRMMTICNGC